MNTAAFISPSSIRRAQFGNGGINFRSREAIPLDQVGTIAPSVFAEGKHQSRSERYAYIPTREVLELLGRNGFHVYSISQGGSKDDEKRGFTKHLLRLRHESATEQLATAIKPGVHTFLGEDGPTFPEIVLLNSHDGTSAYRLASGLFRLACCNGLIVASQELEDIRIGHTGNVGQRVLDGCISIVERLPRIGEEIAHFRSITLNSSERGAFAEAALVARFGVEINGKAPITPDKALEVRRSADQKPTLWNTLNVLQENLLKGGQNYEQRDAATNRVVARRRTREVKSVDGNVQTNRALWALAQALAKHKEA